MINCELLKKFCGPKDDGRPSLEEPFFQDELVYATNGKIAVRVFDASVNHAKCNDAPNMSKVWIDNYSKGNLIPAPKVSVESVVIDCVDCNGTGEITECPECEGDGQVYWSSDRGYTYDDTCGMCNGLGKATSGKKIACEECDGTGKITQAIYVEIGNKIVLLELLHLISLLPNAKIAPTATSETTAMPFVFDGGDGICMPAYPGYRESGKVRNLEEFLVKERGQ